MPDIDDVELPDICAHDWMLVKPPEHISYPIVARCRVCGAGMSSSEAARRLAEMGITVAPARGEHNENH